MKAVVWSKPQCPQCDIAVQILSSKGIEIEIRKLGDGWTKEQLLDAVPTAKSVPQVFIDDRYIGGLKEVRELS